MPARCGGTRSRQFFAFPNVKAREREARCCTQAINRSSLRQSGTRSLITCRSVIAVCAGSRPPSSCTGRTSATEAPTGQRMEARRITIDSAGRQHAGRRSVAMGCGPGAVEIGGCSTSSTPGPPPRFRGRQATPPTANRARAALWPRRPARGGRAGRRPFSGRRLAESGGVLGRSAASAAHAPCVLPRPGDALARKRPALWALPGMATERSLGLVPPSAALGSYTLNRSRNSAARSGLPVTWRLEGGLSGLSALTQAASLPVMRALAFGVSRRSMRARPFSRTNV